MAHVSRVSGEVRVRVSLPCDDGDVAVFGDLWRFPFALRHLFCCRHALIQYSMSLFARTVLQAMELALTVAAVVAVATYGRSVAGAVQRQLLALVSV